MGVTDLVTTFTVEYYDELLSLYLDGSTAAFQKIILRFLK